MMAFRLDPARPLDEEMRRVLREEIAKARAELAGEDRHEAVHDARKRFKKLRAGLRLARPALGAAYGRENARWRDAARRLSASRDATALIESFDALRESFSGALRDGALKRVRARLVERRDAAADADADLDAAVAAVLDELRRGEDLLPALPLPEEVGPLTEGLAATYGRARRALAHARRSWHADDFHEWRKHDKDHWMHLRLFQAAWPEPLAARAKAAEELAEILGDDHDLAVFRGTLAREPDAFGAAQEVEVLFALMDRRQAVLRRAAFDLGGRLFAEKPKALAARLEAYWDAARAEAQRPQAASLAPMPAG